jgi:hypothetical protein
VAPRKRQSSENQSFRKSPTIGAADGSWRPPARESREVHTKRLIRAVTVSLVISGLALWGFARVAKNSPNAVKLGDTEFEVGSATKFAGSIDKDGPLFFPDLVVDDEAQRPLVLTHITGKDFAALNAQPPGSTDEKCVVAYVRAEKVLKDPCTQTVYALDGLSVSGDPSQPKLTRYLSEVNARGALTINLNEKYPDALRDRNSVRK